MKIIILCIFYLFPCTASKIRPVITRRIPILTFSEVEIITILASRIFQCFLKPFMLVRTMIDYKIHNNIHTTFSGFCNQFIKIIHCAKPGIYLIIIRYVISLIYKGRLIYRRKPYNINTQFFEIIQLFNNSS